MTQIGKQKGTKVSHSPHVQQVVTGSRVVGTVYQNTTGRPMTVVASVYISAGAATNFQGLTDGSNPPTTVIGQASVTGTLFVVLIVMTVLAGNYYKVAVTAGTPVVAYWTEWY